MFLLLFLILLCSSTSTTACGCQNRTAPPGRHTAPPGRHTAPPGQTDQSGPTSIFILSGQSNMVGQGGVGVFNNVWDGFIPTLCQSNPQRILRLNNDLAWEPAKEPLHLGITGSNSIGYGIGPGMPFANSLLPSISSDQVLGLVPCASSGTAISQWARGTFLYKNMISRAQAAVANSSNGHIAGMLWYQGESDTGPTATTYKQNLQQFFSDARAELELPNLPIIQVALARQYGSNTDLVRKAQLETDLHNVKCVDAWGLDVIPPVNIHLTTDSQVKLGINLASNFTKFFT